VAGIARSASSRQYQRHSNNNGDCRPQRYSFRSTGLGAPPNRLTSIVSLNAIKPV
jgi:hypothetical protein